MQLTFTSATSTAIGSLRPVRPTRSGLAISVPGLLAVTLLLQGVAVGQGQKVTVTVSPASVSLTNSLTQQFTATVTGNSSSTGVTWSVSPAVGSISNTGLYTAPATISGAQTVTVKATTVGSPSKSGSAIVSLAPPVSVSPTTASLSASQSQQFTAAVIGTTNTGVTWSVSPAVGTLSSTGLYTAPATVSSSQTVTVTATSVANPAASAIASVAITPPVAVSVTPSTTSLSVSQSSQFAATVSGSSNTGVTWSVSPSVGTVSNTGLYAAPTSISSAQTVSIKATSAADPTKSASASVALTPPVIVSLTPLTASLMASQTQQFTATVSGSSNTAVTWSVSPAVGTVSSTGLYTAPASISSAQTVTLTATSAADSTKSASASVALAPPVSVSLTPTTDSLTVSQTQQFTATVSGSSNTAVTWSVSPSVGTVSSTGLYTAPTSISSAQTVTVKATSAADSTKSASASVALAPPVTVSLTPLTASLTASQTQQFTATVGGSSNSGVTWSVNPVVGTVSSTGLYTAPNSVTAQQSVTVTATSAADTTKSASASITLVPPVSVSVSPNSANLTASQTLQFTATVTGSANTAVTWSLNPAVGTISSGGLYTAPSLVTSQQTVTVTATSAADTSKQATASVTIVPPVQVTVSPSTASLAPSGTQQFTAAVTGTTNTAVTWSLNPAVGTISSSGLYSAPATLSIPQTVTVTATSAADTTKKATASVTITPPVTVSLTPTAATMLPSQAQTFTATVGGTSSTGVTWSIAPATGTISSSGLYTTPTTISSASSVTVTAASVADATKSASAMVTVIPPVQITTSSLPDGITGTAYSATLAATGGVAPYTWSIVSGQVPTGLSLSASSGTISGSPTAAGSYNVSVKVTDAAGYQATAVLAIAIAAAACTSCPGLAITTTSLPAGTVGSAYSATLAGSGGTSPYTWSISAGQLPPGLTLASAMGVISGTPSSSGSYSFTAMVTDSASPQKTASQALVLTVGALDSYGGRSDLNCAGGATGAFYTELIGAQWYLCTPAGHPMWGQGAYASGPQGNNIPKYGTSQNPGAAQVASRVATAQRLLAWGFNIIPPYSDVGIWPTSGGMSVAKMAYLPIFRPGLYGMDKNAVAGPLDDAVKDLFNGISPYAPIGNSNGMVDWADTARQKSALHYMLAVDTNNTPYTFVTTPYLDYVVGITIEDSDQTWAFWGGGNGDPFPTQPEGRGSAHGGYLTAIMSPQQQAEAQRWHRLYSDHEVKTKTNWQTYLQAKYTTIAALNTAWGTSGAYTTFGSSATSVTGEAFATTDGTNASFSHTLANAGTISPNSIQIYMDGTMIAGDCFHANRGDACNPVSGTTWGAIYGPTASGGTVNYSTKAITVNFSGTFTVTNRISCSGASCIAEVNVNGDPAFSVGDRIMVRFSTCCSTALEKVTAKSGSAACSDSPPANCYTYTYTNTAAHSGTEDYYGTPRFTNDQIGKVSPPSAGHVLTVNYQVNGWAAGGTGLMDEDRRPSHTWLGTDDSALTDSNANFAADCRAWLGQLATTYFSAMAGQIHDDFTAAGAAVPMYAGPDSFGTWSTPPRKEVLQAAAPYLGMGIMGLSPGYSFTQAELDFITQWFGKPIIGATFLHSQADSPYAASPAEGDYATQPLRGAAFIASIQNSLATRSNGVNPYLGNLWWQYGDNAGENTNWGLVTLKDNAYDGHETGTATVQCSPPLAAYSCGGEAGNYGDVITSVKTANSLWRSR